MAISKEQFADPTREGWWLVSTDADSRLDAARQSLGDALDFGHDAWYSEPSKLERFYDWLSANHPGMLDQLDDQALAADPDRQIAWVTDVTTALAPEPTAPTTDSVAPASTAAAPVAQPAPATSEPPAKKSLFAKKDKGIEEATEQSGEEAPTTSSTETQAEPVKKGLFAKKPTTESAPAQPAGPTPSDEVTVEAAAEVIAHANLPEDIKSDLEAYIADPDVPVSAQEVADLIKEFPDDLEKQLEDAKQDLDQELESFLAEFEESLGE